MLGKRVPTVTDKKLRHKMNDEFFNAGGDAAEDYERLLGHRVIIYYQDQRGQSVIDLFGGSGSTLMACEQLKRQCRTMEYDPVYCDVIIARWEKYTGRKATKIE